MGPPSADPGVTLEGLPDLLTSMTLANKAAQPAAAGSAPPSPKSGGSTTPPPPAIDSETMMMMTTTIQQHRFAELYDLDKRLRSGSYGTVYTCRHKQYQDITYAVKIMDRTKLKPSALESVYREVRIVNELTQAARQQDGRHHGVVQLIDFFVEPNELFMVQVYAAGGDVFDRLTSRRQYTERDARGLALNLLQTVQFLHSRGVVHRDLKPEVGA